MFNDEFEVIERKFDNYILEQYTDWELGSLALFEGSDIDEA